MHRGAALAALLIASLLAGCTAAPAVQHGDPPVENPKARDETTAPPHGDQMCPDGSMHPAGYKCPEDQAGDTMTIRGVVLDLALQPIPEATVLLVELDETQAVGAAGTFQFDDLVPATYFVTASAPDRASKTLSVDADSSQEPLRFVLETAATTPTNESFHFEGHLQCAIEAGIISPSCDSAITYVGGPAVFNSTATFFWPVEANWRTVVADVYFEPTDQAAMDGLRFTVRGTFSPDSLGTYEDYGSFNGSAPFSFRLEPGYVYPGGNTPVPGNITQFQYDAYPHSFGWHATCQDPFPEDPTHCALGAAAGLDVHFDLILTTFYVEPAPEGWAYPV